jgi:hypothetical protein
MSQPGPHSQPAPLNQAEQQQLIQEIGRVILRALPPGWAEASIEYRATGAHSELAAHLLAPNGTTVPLAPPQEIQELFARLREGMHQPDRGTWLSALYQLQRPSSYSVDFNGDYEPIWYDTPAPAEFAEELRRYPRTAPNIPTWLAERADPGATSAPALRHAEVFDGTDADGRPVTERPLIAPEERERIIEYLEKAPVVLAARSYDTDRLTPESTPSVPLTFHTDGHWIWPGAVAYYLRRHQVPPENDLVAHIRDMGFVVPQVDDQIRELAVSLISRNSRD